ncbi:MAG: hypothetical protein IPJ20_26075 [Flammeovirgaceae bacterium]|nr:hypothetical protein [Flammeovirgaceae bacterium]
MKKPEPEALVHTTEPPAPKPDTAAIKKLIEPMIKKEVARKEGLLLVRYCSIRIAPKLKWKLVRAWICCGYFKEESKHNGYNTWPYQITQVVKPTMFDYRPAVPSGR